MRHGNGMKAKSQLLLIVVALFCINSYANWNPNSNRIYKKSNCSTFPNIQGESRSYECYDGKDFEARVKDYYHGPGSFKSDFFYPKKSSINTNVNIDGATKVHSGNKIPTVADVVFHKGLKRLLSKYNGKGDFGCFVIKPNKDALPLVKESVYKHDRIRGYIIQKCYGLDKFNITEEQERIDSIARVLFTTLVFNKKTKLNGRYGKRIFISLNSEILESANKREYIPFTVGAKAYFEDRKYVYRKNDCMKSGSNFYSCVDYPYAKHSKVLFDGDKAYTGYAAYPSAPQKFRKNIKIYSFNDTKDGLEWVDKVELKFSDELNKGIASSDAKSELKEKPLYSTKRADFRYILRDDTKLRSNNGFSDNVIKLLKKGTMVWLKNGGYNSTGLIPVRVDRKTWGYVLKATLSGAKPKEFFSANPTNSEFDNDDSFSGLWGKYGGSILDSKGSLKQQSNYASSASVDTKAPIISLSQSNLTTVESSSYSLSGSVEDDSNVSEVNVNGGLIEIGSSGQFNKAMYLGLGENKFIIEAIDIFGNKASKTIIVVRNIAVVKNKDKKLAPPTIQLANNPNSIALIIGLDDYKSMPNAPWAESDASAFYDYAHNVLGISFDRIHLITGQESDGIGIWKSLEQWLPSQVDKNKSNIYVYFAGHGLASEDGKEAYLMPYDGDTSMLSRTAIPRKDVISGLDSLKARSVTLFMDTCYSGSAKGGKQTLVASRGLRIVKKDALTDLPSNFTLFSAAANDETAISHPTQKNGLFSYWMMRGLGGEADSNNDDKLTNGELHAFISEKVQKTAISKGHNQHPQLVGDKDKVIASW